VLHVPRRTDNFISVGGRDQLGGLTVHPPQQQQSQAQSEHASGQTGGARDLAGAAATQRIMIEAAPGWDGVDPVPPGNEVYVKRPLQYHHAGVYIGHGWIVHLDGSPLIHAERLMLHGRSWATVIKTSVATYAEGGRVTPGPSRPNRPADQITADALAMVGITLEYDPVSRNCQHFTSRIVSGVASSPEGDEAAAVRQALKMASLDVI
jgi:hypothetical protein